MPHKKKSKKGKKKGHHHCPPKKNSARVKYPTAAGNPLDPNDKTLANQFWSA